jgi:VWFA-related protein
MKLKFFLIFASLVVFVIYGFSQDPDIIRVQSRLVLVPVSVIDVDGNPLKGLTKNDFQLDEESKPQQIDELLEADETPLEIAILFDLSASTEKIFDIQREATTQFLREVMRPGDYVTIFAISDKPILVQEKTNAEQAIQAINRLAPSKSFTAFYDTIAAAVSYLQKNSSQKGRKILLAITDGEDTNSTKIAAAIQRGYQELGRKIDTLSQKQLYEYTVRVRDEASKKEQERILKMLQDADVVFYSINFSGSSYRLNKISQNGQDIMQRFAEETGGTAYLPMLLSTDLKDSVKNQSNAELNKQSLVKIFKQLTNELRAQYLIQYYSDAEYPEGKFIRISISLKNPSNFKIKARRGYFTKNRN